MPDGPIAGVTPEVMAALFAGTPGLPDALWRGTVYVLDDGRELLPFVFLELRFIAIFSSPLLEAGGDEAFLIEQVQTWAGNFDPDPNSRLVKFCRAEADHEATLFKPDDWSLDHPRQIFQFSELLAEVMLQHSEILPPVTQYFFWPASNQVERLYLRVYAKVRHLLPNTFEPILADIGEFRGYQRQHPLQPH